MLLFEGKFDPIRGAVRQPQQQRFGRQPLPTLSAAVGAIRIPTARPIIIPRHLEDQPIFRQARRRGQHVREVPVQSHRHDGVHSHLLRQELPAQTSGEVQQRDRTQVAGSLGYSGIHAAAMLLRG